MEWKDSMTVKGSSWNPRFKSMYYWLTLTSNQTAIYSFFHAVALGQGLLGVHEGTGLWVKKKLTIKGLVHPKMKILSLITHPHVIPNP